MRNTVRWTGALVALLVALVAVACQDVPTQPRIDAPVALSCSEIPTPECEEGGGGGSPNTEADTVILKKKAIWSSQWEYRVEHDPGDDQLLRGMYTFDAPGTSFDCTDQGNSYNTTRDCGSFTPDCGEGFMVELTYSYLLEGILYTVSESYYVEFDC